MQHDENLPPEGTIIFDTFKQVKEKNIVKFKQLAQAIADGLGGTLNEKPREAIGSNYSEFGYLHTISVGSPHKRFVELQGSHFNGDVSLYFQKEEVIGYYSNHMFYGRPIERYWLTPDKVSLMVAHAKVFIDTGELPTTERED